MALVHYYIRSPNDNDSTLLSFWVPVPLLCQQYCGERRSSMLKVKSSLVQP